MKKTIIAAAILAVAAGGAFAQSAVTVYGRFNVSAERQKTGDSSVSVLQNNASRIGFRGVEDLGGGLKAGFALEHGFNADTGTPTGSFWGRQSEVNLGGGFGLLRLGTFTSEAYYATADYVSMHNHDTGTSADALYAYLDRDINKIAYRTPEFAGATVEVGTSLKETAAKNTYDVAANWASGALALGAGYQDDGNARQFAVRALYDISPIVVGAYVQRDEDVFAPGKRTNVRLSAMYTLGASEFHANVGRAGKIGGLADSEATQWTLAYNYNLSKRTKVYTFYTRVDNGAAASYLTGMPGVDFSSLALGIRHNF
jgi:predicted porin